MARRREAPAAGSDRRGVPLLGVCLGSQLLADAAGAPAEPAPEPEIGWLEVELTAEGVADPLLAPLAPRFTGSSGTATARRSRPTPVAWLGAPLALQAFRIGASAWGIQFHAEVTEGDAVAWSERYEEDPKAVEVGLDPEAMITAIRERIGAWNRARPGDLRELSRWRRCAVGLPTVGKDHDAEKAAMGIVKSHISVSLDGYVAGPNQSDEDPLGERGEELHGWAVELDGWRARRTARRAA